MESIIDLSAPRINGHDIFCVMAIEFMVAKYLSENPKSNHPPDIYSFSGNIQSEIISFAEKYKINTPVIIVAPGHLHALFVDMPGVNIADFIDLNISLSGFRQQLDTLMKTTEELLVVPLQARTSYVLRSQDIRIVDLLKSGFTLREVARITGLRYGTISHRKRRAMKQLGVHSDYELFYKISLSCAIGNIKFDKMSF